jgi:hypothetical protein
LIQHTPKIQGLPTSTPPELKGSILRAELVVPGLPEQQTGGILNAGVWKSRETQKGKGRLKLYLLDIVRWRGKDVESRAYGEKMPMLAEAGRLSWLHRPRTAFTAGAKARMRAAIAAGREKTTDEGIVSWDRNKNRPTKEKVRPERDVRVTRVFMEKSRRGLAGGFEIEGGGRVGTGFSHALKKHMAENPELYRGLRAKVTSAPGAYGRPQKPAFAGWHLDQNLPPGVKSS